jgi:hypothetical protein
MLLRLFVISLLVKLSFICNGFQTFFAGRWLFFAGRWLFFAGRVIFYVIIKANKPKINWYFILGDSQTFNIERNCLC